VVKKYNCMGCHQLIPPENFAHGHDALSGSDGQEQLPPKLLTEGARVNPEWLLRFLKNPAFNDKTTIATASVLLASAHAHVLVLRNELGKLVRFFQALARQPFPYIPEEIPVLSAKEPRWRAVSSAARRALLEVPRPPAIPLTIAPPRRPISCRPAAA